jgi:hypothetical protein
MRLVPMLALAALAAGCAHREAPYQFRGPVVSSVHVRELRATRVHRTTAPAPVYDVLPVDPYTPSPATPSPFTPNPRPLDPYAPLPPTARPADALRALVGLRMKHATDIDFIRTALTALDAPLGAEFAELADGPALVALAEARNARTTTTTPLRGDIIVFDDFVPRQPASCLGVVVAVDARGVVEFVYLTRGVVRRGFLSDARPTEKRDAEGRVLNTILRQEHAGHKNKGIGDLSGQLRSGYLRLERLIAP